MTLVDDLNAKLRTSMRRRDRPVTDALRSVLGDLANAEAIPMPEAGGSMEVSHPRIAGSTAGLGATEARRQEVSAKGQRAIAAEHRTQLLAHAERLTQLCRHEEADGVRRAAKVLEQLLSQPTS